VLAAGLPCEVESATFSEIICRTVEKPDGWQAAGTSKAGLFVGGRGVKFLQWPSGTVDKRFKWTGTLKVCQLIQCCLISTGKRIEY
jgi:hypothetical protein